jgi:hypothetical protein
VSTLAVNTITNAAGGNTAQINGMTPTADSLQGFRNRVINGNMVIDQRNAGASVTGVAGEYAYPVDRFKFYNAASSKLSGQRSTVAPTGFTNSILLTSLAATTPAAGDEYQLYHQIEGFNTADLGFGTASAQSITLSFWVRSSLTGTFSGAVNNNGGTRSYVFTYAIAAANTWEQKTITIAGDTTGTWSTGNQIGFQVLWDLGSGSNFEATAGSWLSAFDCRTNGSVRLIGTSGATFYITGVQLEKGSVATEFERRPYGTELQLCCRYYQKTYDIGTVPGSVTSASYWNGGSWAESSAIVWGASWRFPVEMRSTPTITTYSNDTGASGQIGVRSAGFSSSGVAALSFGAGSKAAGVYATSASGMTTGQGLALVGHFVVSAEL